MVKATAKLASRLKFDLNRLKIPDALKNRMKFRPADFIENALKPPKWIRDRLRPPKWLRDRLKLSQFKPLRGVIEVLDANGRVFQFKRQDRKMTLDWTPIEFRVGPQLPGDLQNVNPFDLLTKKTTTTINGIFSKTLQTTLPLIGTPIRYSICYTLDNGDLRITNNGIFPTTVCAGSFKPRDFPYLIQIKNHNSQTAAMIQFAKVEAIRKLGIHTKRVNVFQGGLGNPATWKTNAESDSIGAFAPCGEITNLPDYQKAALIGSGVAVMAPFLTFDIYIKAKEDFLTVVHEFAHIAHCSLIGQDKYRQQISKYAEDVVQGINPRNSEYGKMHEGIANYMEFILNANMNYCPQFGCKNIEENHHSGYIQNPFDWENFLISPSLLGDYVGSTPHIDYDIYNGLEKKQFVNTLYPPIYKDYFDNNQIIAISSFLYDLEDSCEDSFRKIINSSLFPPLSSNRYFDRVFIGRANLIQIIKNLPYPTKLNDLGPMVLGLGVTEDSFWELVDLHGLNGLTRGLGKVNPLDTLLYSSFINFEVSKSDFDEIQSNKCLSDVPSAIQQDLHLASNIAGLNRQPQFRRETTPILELDKTISMDSFKNKHVPTSALSVTWKKENQDSDIPNLSFTEIEEGKYQTNSVTWTSEYGIGWDEFLEESTPLQSNQITWLPTGKENKDMGVIEYTRIDNVTSEDLEYFWFTNALPEYASQNQSFDQFLDTISPEGCQNRTWVPTGKPLRKMGTECWTGVGYFGTIITEDYCSDIIDYDDRHTVAKSPVSINEHFVHYYDQKVGKLSCDFHTRTSSGLMEYDDRIHYAYPPNYTESSWTHFYYQKDGKIQFNNPSPISEFITRSGIQYAHLSEKKEKGYFEYYVENK